MTMGDGESAWDGYIYIEGVIILCRGEGIFPL